MNRFFRAASYAAASFVAVFGTFYAGPSLAWELDSPPALSPTSILPIAQAESAAEPVEATVARAPSAAPVAPVVPVEPEPPVRRSLAQLVSEHSSASTADAEHDCLAGAVYFESKGEPLNGQLSVAEVVLNRARSGRFPASLCGVVKQRGQFSFIRGGRFPAIPRATAAWRKAVAIARIALDDTADGAAPKALFFHATRVSPRWRGLKRIATVGNHVFYR
jgi:hypothetical protein